MPVTIAVKPELILWAIDRSQLPPEDLAKNFPKLEEWRTGQRQPTLRQLESFAKQTMTPLGYLFLDSPPDEKLAIPDFRTVADAPIRRPSPNLIETVHAMQRRQDWMRDYLLRGGGGTAWFVGSAKETRNVASVAARIRETLALAADWAERLASWEEALRTLRRAAEEIGALVAPAAWWG